MKKQRTTEKPSAEICLYGNHELGAGYIAAIDRKIVTVSETADPKRDRTFTDAVFLGVGALRDTGYTTGTVRVYDVGGLRMADIQVSNPPYYGSMDWKPAQVYEIPLADLLAAVENRERS